MIHEQKGIVCDFASPFGVRRFDRIPLVPPASNASACDRDEWGTNQGLYNKIYVEHLFAMFNHIVHPNTTT